MQRANTLIATQPGTSDALTHVEMCLSSAARRLRSGALACTGENVNHHLVPILLHKSRVSLITRCVLGVYATRQPVYVWRRSRTCSARALARAARARQAAKQPQSAATHSPCMLVVTELTSSTVLVLGVIYMPQQLHTLPASRGRARGHWRPARDALIAQDAETRQNHLQSTPRPENDISGRHMTTHERNGRRTCQRGRNASSPRRGALPSPFAALRTAGRRPAQHRRECRRRSSHAAVHVTARKNSASLFSIVHLCLA